MPDNVSVPPATVTPPVPPITPLKLVFALLRVRLCAPKVTVPAPESVEMLAPLVVAAMSKVPALATPLDAAMLPVPLSAKVAPISIEVPPV